MSHKTVLLPQQMSQWTI